MKPTWFERLPEKDREHLRESNIKSLGGLKQARILQRKARANCAHCKRIAVAVGVEVVR